ncbi:hypothetical protein CBR_g10998 [Chara braunii]|uniref:Complex III subunit VI n=1 Tax=Chara braunii TaxID=69332 RepID=A0A388KQ56_CHABU|nr:hypothetical protein CBR_g10998 [Chara braunii]|eukprot:GBG72063.1 hypothetical protein CBR_g10998 [Chara braunii]
MADNGDEPVDPRPKMEESCKPNCVKQLLQYQACVERLEKDDTGAKHCTGQSFDYLACMDKCVALKLFAKLRPYSVAMDEEEEPGEKRYLKRRIRPGLIELVPDDSAIIVHYEVEASVLRPDGNTVVVEKKPSEKRIKVKGLTATSDITALASEIVSKCKVLTQSKTPQVEQLLHQLLQRRELGSGSRFDGGDKDMQELQKRRIAEEKYTDAQRRLIRSETERARMEDLDLYLEWLYEGMDEKIKASSMVCQLARRTENMEGLLAHTTLIGALARVLREDGRKSLDLCRNIISLFFAFSNFSQFHHVILEHQVGNMTMNIIDLEIQRTEARLQAEGPAALAVLPTPGTVPSEKEIRTMQLNRKQEKLLYISFYLLLNLAEDVNIEKKMKKRNIVVYLSKMLTRRSIELLILVTTFLKKLSIYQENKDVMAQEAVVDKLAVFVPCQTETLLICVLRLLLNLSFDAKLRDDVVRNGLIPKLVGLLRAPRLQNLVLGLLYHLSIEDKHKSVFTPTEAVSIVFDLLVENPDTLSTPELIALAVNLTANEKNAEAMCEGDGFEVIISRGIHMRDPLIFKLVRNFSQHEDIKPRFVPYLRDLVRLLRAPETSSDLMVEVMGTLGNLTNAASALEGLVQEFDLLRFLSNHIHPGVIEDDILLEVVIFTGTTCTEASAPGLVSSGLVQKICGLLLERREDDDMVLQVCYTFSRFMLYEATRSALMRNVQVVCYLVELLRERNKAVTKMADKVLDMIMAADPHAAPKIKRMKFESYNHAWLELVDEESMEEEEDDDEEEEERQLSPSSSSYAGRRHAFKRALVSSDGAAHHHPSLIRSSDEDEATTSDFSPVSATENFLSPWKDLNCPDDFLTSMQLQNVYWNDDIYSRDYSLMDDVIDYQDTHGYLM